MPYNTPLPDWKFTDALATDGTFNATAAEVVAQNLFASSSANTGAIAGGTVGGFVVGGILGALVAILAARKKAVKGTDDGQRSIHSQDTRDTSLMEEKARVAGLA